MADDLSVTGEPAGGQLPGSVPGELPAPLLTERPEPAPEPRPALVRQRSPLYTHRFAIAYALLAAVVGVAVGGFIVLVGRATGPSGPAWSSWKPSGDNTQKVSEIAQYVSSQYQLQRGQKLVGVLAGPPAVQNVPVGHFALAKDSSGQNYSILSASNSIEFQLCGFGPSCSIKSGSATVQRGRLLHRQAVELALYTFKYTGVDKVLTLLPPPPGKQPTTALFFQRDDLKPELSQPLRHTLAPRAALTPSDMTSLEQEHVANLTDNHFFSYTFQQAPDRSVVLVLNQLQI
jgi:hypothetical protein